MKPKPPTDTLLGNAKRYSKKQAALGVATHAEALEEQAIEAGYPSWRALRAANAAKKIAAGKTPAEQELRVDPVLPRLFDQTANEDRPAKILDDWWDKPFAVTLPSGGYEVRCLDGGAWDRPTHYGIAKDLEDAQRIAREKLAGWLRFRVRPTAMMREDGKFDVVRMPQRPDGEPVMLASGLSAEAAAAWINLNKSAT